VDLCIHCVGLAGVDHKEDLVVSLLLVHLLEGISQIVGANFFRILKFQKLIASMTRHVHKDVGLVICQKPFGARGILCDAT